MPGPARRPYQRHQGHQGAPRSPGPTGAATNATRCSSGSTAPPSAREQELDDHLKRLEEAKRRDHRVLGRELDLFSVDGLVGPGFVLWHPRAASVRQLVEDLIRDETQRRGCEPVYTRTSPGRHCWRSPATWPTTRRTCSGAWSWKASVTWSSPMNCPFHVAIYKSGLRSYRDLPLRLSELGTSTRYSARGSCAGLLRVRGFTQDDAHLVRDRGSIEAEMQGCVRFALSILGLFGFSDIRFFMATDRTASWAIPPCGTSQASIRRVLEGASVAFEVDEGGGAFYGPKDRSEDQGTPSAGNGNAGPSSWTSSCPSASNWIRRRRWPPAPPGGGIPPGLARVVERFIAVVLEHHAGAPAAVAQPGAGPGAVGQREGRGLCRRGRRGPDGGRVACRGRRPRRQAGSIRSWRR